MKGMRVFKAMQTWSKPDMQIGAESVIDLMTYFQRARSINDLQMPNMLPYLTLLTPLAVWHFAVIQYEINFCPVPVWQNPNTGYQAFIILYNPV